MQYSDYQNASSSEKITLAIMSASKRLMGWALDSGSIYKIVGFQYRVISDLADSGTSYAVSPDFASITTGSYYLDQITQTLYVQAAGSVNPNGLFLVVTVDLHFANVPINLPSGLTSGFDVPYEPLIKSTSEFGVGIDTIAQVSAAIEGNGTLTFNNDYSFWPANFDKLSFENQKVLVYSYNRNLDPSEARIIYKGIVNQQTYSAGTVVFQLIDQFITLRAEVPMPTIGSLNVRTGVDYANAKQRMVLGRVFGHIPTNLDQVLDGYPITGTVSVTSGSITVTGIGSTFLAELSPADHLILSGGDYTIATVDSDTSLTLTGAFTSAQPLTGGPAVVVPDQPKRYMNRIFKVAGHAVREPVTTIRAGSNILTLFVDDNRDIYAGDTVYIGTLGSGEIATVHNVVGQNYIELSTSLVTVPSVGTTLRRPAVQNVRIDDVRLIYYRDYTFDAATAVLTLSKLAEVLPSPTYQMPADVVIISGDRTVTGVGFQAAIKPGYMVGVVGTTAFFEVLSVDSDTQLTLRDFATVDGTGAGLFKNVIYDPANSVLTLDILGRTEDGTSDGIFVKTAPGLNKLLLIDAGLESELDTGSFDAAEDVAYQEIGSVLPPGFQDTTGPIFRDTLNSINTSVFGSLYQNLEYKFAYQVLSPVKNIQATKFSEPDVLAWTLTSTAQNIAQTVIVEYQTREYDFLTKATPLTLTVQSVSDVAEFILKTDVSTTITTCLANQLDAQLMANRWSFLLQTSAGRLTFTTKLQGMSLQVGDIIEIEHRKFYERFGSTGKRKLLLVESVTKSGSTVTVNGADLSNTFNRVAAINGFTTDWTSAIETERLYGGYITDQYGLIDNDSDSFETNLIW